MLTNKTFCPVISIIVLYLHIAVCVYVLGVLTIHAISILSSMRQALLIIGAIIDANNKENSINKWQKGPQSIPSTGSIMVVVFPCSAQLKALIASV